MVRSLGLLMVVVVPVWFFAQPPDSDEAELRVVDPAADIAAFSADQPAVPVPGELPEDWRPTSTTYLGGTSELRVGWVTPEGQYAEYAALEGPREDALEVLVGEGTEQLDDLVVDGVRYELYRDGDGSLSYVRGVGGVTVVVGTLRATAG